MEELIKTIKQYKGIAINASAVLMFIFFGFGPVIDVMGKVQMNGLNLLFKGSKLGFHWFLALFNIISSDTYSIRQICKTEVYWQDE